MKTELTLLEPGLLAASFAKVEAYLPDALRSIEAWCSLPSTTRFEVGQFQGLVWLTDVIVGWKADIHVVIWDDEFRHRADLGKQVVQDLIKLFKLQRLSAFIPVTNEIAMRYAEKCGLHLEGVLRKAAIYDGGYIDIAAYSWAQGDD